MIIDTSDQLADLFAVPSGKNRIIRSKICLLHISSRIQAAEPNPDILPWLLGIGKIMNCGIGIAEEGVSRLQLITLVATDERPFPANDIVEQKMIANARAPSITGGTLLTARILDIE